MRADGLFTEKYLAQSSNYRTCLDLPDRFYIATVASNFGFLASPVSTNYYNIKD